MGSIIIELVCKDWVNVVLCKPHMTQYHGRVAPNISLTINLAWLQTHNCLIILTMLNLYLRNLFDVAFLKDIKTVIFYSIICFIIPLGALQETVAPPIKGHPPSRTTALTLNSLHSRPNDQPPFQPSISPPSNPLFTFLN